MKLISGLLKIIGNLIVLKVLLLRLLEQVRLVQGSEKGFVPKEGKINNFDNEIGFIGKGTEIKLF